MATLQEHAESMTIYYRKATGDIKSITTGIQDMSAFGDETSDYSLIWDYVVLARDNFVLSNPLNFKINVETKTIEIKSGSLNYPIEGS